MGENAIAVLNLAVGLLGQLSSLSALLSKAKAEGRDITDAELDALARQDAEARSRLAEAIAGARAQGR